MRPISYSRYVSAVTVCQNRTLRILLPLALCFFPLAIADTCTRSSLTKLLMGFNQLVDLLLQDVAERLDV